MHIQLRGETVSVTNTLYPKVIPTMVTAYSEGKIEELHII